jgi:hypothetical protein
LERVSTMKSGISFFNNNSMECHDSRELVCGRKTENLRKIERLSLNKLSFGEVFSNGIFLSNLSIKSEDSSWF